MEVETLIIDPLKPNYKSFHQQTPYKTTKRGIEIKVIYVRIISSTPIQSNIEIAFPSRGVDTRLRVNGSEIDPGASTSMTLKRNRVDTLMSEYIYVNTNTIKFCGSSLPFEIRVQCSSLSFMGVLRRKGDGLGCLWVMECREGGSNLGVDGGLVDVYFAGRSLGRPLLLNGVVELKKRGRGLDCIHECDETGSDGSKKLEEKGVVKEHGDELANSYYKSGEEEMLEEDEGELSWFNAGVRVGMGLGLGMCLGVGVGLGLVLRTYQSATGAFRRFI